MDSYPSKGMIPGLWLEIEVMGIRCELAEKLPDDWFFFRHGKRVYDRSRYQLDFRNPEVRALADGVIDRLVSVNTTSATSRWTTISSRVSGRN